MRYTRFEELPVWNRAIELAVEVYDLTSRSEFRNRYSLRDQLERATVSVSNNIAEGFERGTTQELLTFIYIARGSAGEVRSMLCCSNGSPSSPISNLKSKAEGISRQLRGGLIPCRTLISKVSDICRRDRSVPRRRQKNGKSSWTSLLKSARRLKLAARTIRNQITFAARRSTHNLRMNAYALT